VPPGGAKAATDPLMSLLGNKRLIGFIKGDSNPVEVSLSMSPKRLFLSIS